jgi:hypothetical protein
MRRNVSLSLTQLGSIAALAGTLLLLPRAALAQDDITLSMARERFKEGVAYFDKKDFAKARVAFLQAYALKKHPAVLLNLAQSELRSGHEADAAKHFAQYLREHKDATDSERQGAETGLTAAKALVGEVALEVDTVGAEVYVDGDLEGSAPLPGSIFLAPGTHELQARKDGKTTKSEINATAGQSSSVSLRLAAPGRPATPVAGGTGEPAPEGEPPPPEEPDRPRKPFGAWLTSTPGAMVGVGLTGAGLIGGGAFAFGSKSAYDAADSVAVGIKKKAIEVDKLNNPNRGPCNNPDEWLHFMTDEPAKSAYSDPIKRQDRVAQYEMNCAKYTDNVKSGDTYKTLAIVSFAVAGAAAVGTIVYYFVDSKESGPSARAKSQRRIMVLPVYQEGYAGGIISGSF